MEADNDTWTIEIIAPSGPVDPERLARGRRCLEARARARRVRLRIREAANLAQVTGYTAGDDRCRAEALTGAHRGDATILWAARGGYGATRILSRLDPRMPRDHPKLVIGFSDITAIHAWQRVCGAPRGIHGPGICQLPDLDPRQIDELLDMLDGGDPTPHDASSGTALYGGTVEGPLFAGNLEVLRSLVGTPHLPNLAGHLLALEDVGEAAYRVDRSLTQLIEAGALRGIVGFALGQFSTRSRDGGHVPHDPEVEAAVVARLEELRIPLVSGFEFGHCPPNNRPLIIGARTRLDASRGILESLEPLVPPFVGSSS